MYLHDDQVPQIDLLPDRVEKLRIRYMDLEMEYWGQIHHLSKEPHGRGFAFGTLNKKVCCVG